MRLPLLLLLLVGCRHGLPEAPPAPKPQAPPSTPTPAPAGARLFEGGIAPFLDRYCVSCHGPAKQKGGVALHGLVDDAAVRAKPALWQAVLEQVAAGDMPPDDQPQPTLDERARLGQWLEARVFRCDEPHVEARAMTVRRLNRTEYERTVRDLLGVEVDVAADLPSDNSGHGFDNMAEALTTSPLHVERYLAAADRALDAAVFDPALAKRRRQRLRAEKMSLGGAARPLATGWVALTSQTEDELAHEIVAPAEATFAVRVHAALHPEPPPPAPPPRPARPNPPNAPPAPVTPPPPAPPPPRRDLAVLSVFVDDRIATTIEVRAPTGKPRTYEARVAVPPGRHQIRVALLRDKTGLHPIEAALPRTGKAQGIGLSVKTVELEGPVGPAPGPTAAHRRLFFRTPARPGDEGEARTAATEILRAFAARAFHRPPTDDELARLVELAARAWKGGARFEAGVRQGLRAVLVSPQFLFRREVETAPAGGAPTTDYALAARLSYFLWSTVPDEELLAHAARGTLRANLRAQVERMLAHDKARAFVDGFAGQWLEFRALEDVTPAWFRFRSFDEPLRHAMRRETELLFEHVLREKKSALELLSARYTFVNERLAKHYGMEGVKGDAFQKVSLEGTPRRGILTHGSVLTLTSNPTRTSPVKRGKWVLEALLNAPPPPPPPDVPSLVEGRRVKGTVRERLEQHRADPACATCHARMDPIGFGLEAFDGIGALRTLDNGEKLDTRGTLTSGEAFDGALPLIDVLVEKKKEPYLRAIASKMLMYALGRGLEPRDRCTVDAIVRKAGDEDHRLASFVVAVAESAPFLDTLPRPAPPSAPVTLK